MKFIKLKLFLGFLSICLLFFGCEKEQKLETIKEKKQEVLKNLQLNANNGEWLIINQKAAPELNNFKNIAPQKREILKDLIVTNDKKNIKILVFFTTWCDPCKGILPHLESLQNQFGDEISFYGIAIDDLVGEVQNFKSVMQVFSEENEVGIPLVLDENRVALFKALGGVEGVPLIAMYDKNGAYIIHYLGAIPEEMIEFDLSQNISKAKAQ
ncbi:MAG: TlpA disulfide reductase family protein [Helicobacteraceae bacterium]|nr:TlpA disulfide reductase family protein [Helicobacteraceae bacterium]